MEFSETEIQLCKEIWDTGVKKPLLFYEYFTLGCDNSPFVLGGSVFWNGDEDEIYQDYPGKPIKYGKGEWWPLWQIHDCFEWLRKKEICDFEIVGLKKGGSEIYGYDSCEGLHNFNGETLLEALLRLVIAIAKWEKPCGGEIDEQ